MVVPSKTELLIIIHVLGWMDATKRLDSCSFKRFSSVFQLENVDRQKINRIVRLFACLRLYFS